jgi:hypothetical protein
LKNGDLAWSDPDPPLGPEFSAAIATESGQVPFNLPVLIPNGNALYNPDLQLPPPSIGLTPPSDVTPPPQEETVGHAVLAPLRPFSKNH